MTGTYNLVPVTVNDGGVRAFIATLAGLSSCAGTAACIAISVKIQFLYHVKIIYTSQLINGIFNI